MLPGHLVCGFVGISGRNEPRVLLLPATTAEKLDLVYVHDHRAKVGLSQSACWTRLKRLESSGAIQRYVAILDHKAIGLANIVFVHVILNKHDDKVLEEFGAALARMPEVIEAHLVSGDYDIW
jgi:hypothetical protein